MTATVTFVSRLGDHHNQLKLRELCIYLLLIALFTFLGALIWIGFRYSTPQSKLVLLGNLADFPPNTEPYRVVNEAANVYVVNLGEQLLALDPYTPQSQRCRVLWVAPNHRFEDPCSGAKFALNGGYLEGPAWGHLARYAIQNFGDGKLSVDLTTAIVETKTEFIQRCLIAQQDNALRSAENRLWGEESDEDFCAHFWDAASH